MVNWELADNISTIFINSKAKFIYYTVWERKKPTNQKTPPNLSFHSLWGFSDNMQPDFSVNTEEYFSPEIQIFSLLYKR